MNRVASLAYFVEEDSLALKFFEGDEFPGAITARWSTAEARPDVAYQRGESGRLYALQLRPASTWVPPRVLNDFLSSSLEPLGARPLDDLEDALVFPLFAEGLDVASYRSEVEVDGIQLELFHAKSTRVVAVLLKEVSRWLSGNAP